MAAYNLVLAVLGVPQPPGLAALASRRSSWVIVAVVVAAATPVGVAEPRWRTSGSLYAAFLLPRRPTPGYVAFVLRSFTALLHNPVRGAVHVSLLTGLTAVVAAGRAAVTRALVRSSLIAPARPFSTPDDPPSAVTAHSQEGPCCLPERRPILRAPHSRSS